MGKNRVYGQDMLSGPLVRSVARYTIPIILTNVLQLLFNAADLVVVGQFAGELSVAAVGNSGSIINLIVNLFIGLSVGASVAVAYSIGENKAEDVHKAVHTAVPTALVGGVIITFIGVFFSETFLRMMDTPENVLPLSALYMRIYFAGSVFMLIYNFCAAILRASGDTKSPLVFLIIAGVINVILNLIFVVFCHMDVAGVALATTISQAVSATLVVIALMKRTDACRFIPSKMRFHKQPLLKMIKIGIPAGIQGSLFSISNVIIQTSINSFGEIFMSGNAAASNIESFIYSIIVAFHQTALNFISQNMGAGQYRRAKKVLRVCILGVTVVCLVVCACVVLFGRGILSVYIPNSAEAIEWGMLRVIYLCIPYFLCGMMDVTTGSLRGLGSSVVPMLISVIGVCGIRIAWVFTVFRIPEYHTPQCLYLSYPLSWAVTFLLELIAFLILFKKKTDAAKPSPLSK